MKDDKNNDFKKWEKEWLEKEWPKIIKEKNIEFIGGIEKEDLYPNFYKKYGKYPEDFFEKYSFEDLKKILEIDCLKKHFCCNLEDNIKDKFDLINSMSNTEVPEDCLLRIVEKLEAL